jgi:hypothetical protein
MKSGQLKRTTAAFTVATLVLLFGSQKPTRAQAAASGRLLVLSKGALTLSVVDPVTLQVPNGRELWTASLRGKSRLSISQVRS